MLRLDVLAAKAAAFGSLTGMPPDQFDALYDDFAPLFRRRHHPLRRAAPRPPGVNPILVQEMFGHTTLEMTRQYTHLGMDSMREALQRLTAPPDTEDRFQVK